MNGAVSEMMNGCEENFYGFKIESEQGIIY